MTRTATDELVTLQAKLDNNLHFVGFPERSEGYRPEQFLCY